MNSSVTEMFDQISSNYDRVNRILSFGMDTFWRKKMASFLPKDRPLQLLDLATGTADQIIFFFEKRKNIEKAIGIDLAKEMLLIGRKKLAEKPYGKRIQLEVGDALQLPFASNSFDIISLSFGIRNFSDPLKGLKEMHRALKKEGRALILEFSMPKFFLLKKSFQFYLKYILPFLGGRLSSKKSAYEYLAKTIASFPHGKAFCSLMQKAGFKEITCHPLALGGVSIYLGEK